MSKKEAMSTDETVDPSISKSKEVPGDGIEKEPIESEVGEVVELKDVEENEEEIGNDEMSMSLFFSPTRMIPIEVRDGPFLRNPCTMQFYLEILDKQNEILSYLNKLDLKK